MLFEPRESFQKNKCENFLKGLLHLSLAFRLTPPMVGRFFVASQPCEETSPRLVESPEPLLQSRQAIIRGGRVLSCRPVVWPVLGIKDRQIDSEAADKELDSNLKLNDLDERQVSTPHFSREVSS